MKPKLLLRIASVLIPLHALGHIYGFSGWKETTDPVKQEVISQMFGHSFEFKGSVRSLGEYYDEYGWFATIALLTIAVLL
jgi:hypothetical protein